MSELPGYPPLSFRFKIIRFFVLLLLSPFRKKINGIENLPLGHPFIIAANHASYVDGYIIHAYLSKIINSYIHFLTYRIFFKIPLIGLTLRVGKAIRVDMKEEAKSLFIVLQYLQNGEVIGIFPEGRRSETGKIQKGRPGVALLALKAKVPVVPLGLVNTNNILPRGKFLPRLVTFEINIGKPLDFSQYYSDYDEAINQNNSEKMTEIEAKVVKSIMLEIARLSKQEYPF